MQSLCNSVETIKGFIIGGVHVQGVTVHGGTRGYGPWEYK